MEMPYVAIIATEASERIALNATVEPMLMREMRMVKSAVARMELTGTRYVG